MKLHVEELEGRFLMSTLPHADNPVLQAEHLAVMNLVAVEAATHTVVSDGFWSDPAVWDHGVPGDGANVVIPVGFTVLLDTVETAVIRTVRVDGTFVFAPAADTGLTVDTMVVAPTGRLTIGTADSPVTGSATITIADQGPIDAVWDPLLFSRGIISHGAVEIHGEEKTAWMPLADAPKKGDVLLFLDGTPSSWQVGDKLILPGVNPSANEDEQLEILGINDATVIVRPLTFNHIPPAVASVPGVPDVDLRVHVANVTRNVVIQSQNPETSRRGHVMFMHSPNVHVSGLSLIDMGRTDKKQPLNNAKLDAATGQRIPSTGLNQVGRYAVHFHRAGATTPATISDSVVLGSPGWGFVNHSSNVEIEDNVAFNAVGAGFVTEAGDEVGSFRRNFSIRNTGSGLNIDNATRNAVNDFGHTGDGFWMQSPGVFMEYNVAAGARRSGFTYLALALVQPGLPIGRFPAKRLVDPSIAGGEATIPIRAVPIGSFVGNHSYGNGKGAAEFWNVREQYTANEVATKSAPYRSVISGLVAWNLGGSALTLEYIRAFDLTDNVLIANNPIKAANTGMGMNNATSDLKYIGNRIEGFEFGITAAVGRFRIEGGYLRNLNNIQVRESPLGSRRDGFIATDVLFGELTSQELYGRTQRNIWMNFGSTAYYLTDSAGNSRAQDRIMYGDTELFFRQQASDFLPYPTGGASIAAALVGKTVGHIRDSFGLQIAGATTPAGSLQLPVSDALVGEPVEREMYLQLLSPVQAPIASPYTLRYRTEYGVEVTVQTPFTLASGWNVLTLLHDGKLRSILVQGI